MQCWNCGATVRKGAKICVYCGAQLASNANNSEEAYQREPAAFDAERKPAPEYRPSGGDSGRGRDGGQPYDGAPARGLLSGSRGPRPDESSSDRNRSPTASPRMRRATPPPPQPPMEDQWPPHAPRSRPNEPDERGRFDEEERGGHRSSRGRPEPRDYPPEDDFENRRRPSRPVPGGDWEEPSRVREREREPERGGSRFGEYDDESRPYRAEREREGSYRRDEPGRGDGWGRRDYREYDGPEEDAYPSDEWEAPRDWRREDDRWQDPAPSGPLDDSWGLPALTGPEVRVQGWTDEWQAHAGAAPPWASPPRQRPNEPVRARRQAPRRKRGGRPLLVTLLVALALAMIVGGAMLGSMLLRRIGGSAPTAAPTFATYTPGPTPTVVPSYKQYVSAQSNFVLNYPQDWSQSNANDTSQGQPDYLDTFAQGSGSVVVERSPAFDTASDAQIIQGEVRGGQQAGLTFTETTSAAGTVAIGGEQWTRREYDVSSQGNKEHMAIFSCHHEGRGYAIVLRGPASSYPQLYSNTFKIMLSSFRFTN